jgi:3-oxoacyl-(acyl-carrier-protein) synthase
MVDVDVLPYLRRKKDRKLLARAAELALAPAARALGERDAAHIAVFLGVGREPPEDESEGALVAAMREGHLAEHELDPSLWPPLASLRTLPNLILAHVAIQLELTGEGGTRAGGAAAGLAAVLDAARAVDEGRAEVALAGASDSLVAPALVRDHVRAGFLLPTGEAAVMLRLEAHARAVARGAHVYAVIVGGADGVGSGKLTEFPHRWALGDCGAADGALSFVLGLGADPSGEVEVVDPSGARAALCWAAPGSP